MPTREELHEFAAALAAELAPEPPLPPPSFNHNGLEMRAQDVFVRPGDRIVHVPVVLNKPTNQTVTVRYLSANGTVNQDSYFKRADGYLSFHPGEQFKTVPVELLRDFAAGQNFKLTLIQPQNNQTGGIVKDNTALVSGDPLTVETFTIPTSFPLSEKPTGLSLVFDERFGSDWECTDSGYKADGVTPCWRSRMQWHPGRTHESLGVTVWYTDPVLHPACKPWIRDAAGKLVLQNEFFPNGVLTADGNTIPCSTSIDPAGFYRFSGPMITTQRFAGAEIEVGTYVEARMKMPTLRGLWPALWFLAGDGSWPSIEIDMFEGFFNSASTIDKVGTTVHWKNSSGSHSMFNMQLAHLSRVPIDLALPHTWGCYWGEKQLVFYIDGIPYMAVPNVFPNKKCFLKINIGVGGIAGNPSNPSQDLPGLSAMPMDFVKIWKPLP